MTTIVMANQKGGMGKTTTAIALASALVTQKRVLIIDSDPQGNLTAAMGWLCEFLKGRYIGVAF